ncbi:MAG: hypothetical protein ACFFCS_05175 [Candidatus Hodarchaeota archaeon]
MRPVFLHDGHARRTRGRLACIVKSPGLGAHVRLAAGHLAPAGPANGRGELESPAELLVDGDLLHGLHGLHRFHFNSPSPWIFSTLRLVYSLFQCWTRCPRAPP